MAVAAVAADEERRRELVPSASVTVAPPGPTDCAGDRGAGADLDARRLQRRGERGAQVAVLDDVAHRAFVDLVLVEVEEGRRGALARRGRR